ncbi:hypothetical protein AB4Z52_34445 [Rhizobium sp. 2YAF20]|uniref:hypothetical protein n=1 Tax=Rhizobium sp. 2YAF20 TaxID=3233027 RepID=UPI003F9D4B92
MGPVYVSDCGSLDQLGNNVVAALNQSKIGIPHPAQSEWKALQAPMLTAAGVKSWAKFAKKTMAVGIEYEGDSVSLIPSSNYENKGGDTPWEKTVKSGVSAEELGPALLKAFDACD